MSGSAGKALIYLIVLFFAGLYSIYRGVKNYSFMQKIKNIATSKVRSVAVGLAELYGKAECLEFMESPIIKRKCVYWKTLAEYYRSGKHGGWKKIYQKNSSNKFYLKDSTGKILVDPKNAEIQIPIDKRYNGYISGRGFFGVPHKKMDKLVLNYIETLDEGDKKKFMNHNRQNVRVFEYYIAEGDKIYILGNAEIIDNAKSERGHENLIIKKGKFENVMYISDSHEKKIVDKLRGLSRWEIGVGVVLSTVCLFLLLAMLSL